MMNGEDNFFYISKLIEDEVSHAHYILPPASTVYYIRN